MAEIFNKHVRKKIQENQSITHSDIYLMLNRYCELFSHHDTKPYPEELIVNYSGHDPRSGVS